MQRVLENAVSATWVNVAMAWRLWHAQLEAVQRYGRVWREYVLARGATTPTPATEAFDIQAALGADPHISDLLVCWRDMYEAATMHEAIGEIQPQIARLAEDSREEFRKGLAAARLSGRLLMNPAPPGADG